ncbi:PhoH family protein [Candidatus Omnitrophus magneticus]|uniref:PhoH family protein n=1 Tax=Candidatus Omnitrophus magneticus TaxID=1609969 RepID=A0A0F0CN24_9BACT|nr:PhoH family protein [Candidatus Omnitrophus magneticus]
MKEKNIEIRDDSEAKRLFGKHDETLKRIEKAFGINTIYKEGSLRIISSSEESLRNSEKVISGFLAVLRAGGQFSMRDIDYAVKNVHDGTRIENIFLDRVEVYAKKNYISAHSAGQKKYLDAIRQYDIVFGIGRQEQAKHIWQWQWLLTR